MQQNTEHHQPERTCDQCGYSLAGLPKGALCPECGAASRESSGVAARDATMSVEAPSWFIKRVRMGLLVCVLGVLGIVFFGLLMALTPDTQKTAMGFFVLLRLAAAGAWCAGVWFVTRERSGIGTLAPDSTLDNGLIRKSARWLACAVPGAVLLSGIVSVTGGTAPGLVSGLINLVWLAAWIGLVPFGGYCSAVAYWASDEHVSSRLQNVTWLMCAAGVLQVVMKLSIAMGLSFDALAKIVSFWLTVVLVLSTGYLLIQTVRLSSVLAWVVKHQKARAGSAARVREKIERRMKDPHHVPEGTECSGCGYDLGGLAFGGRCPECGESFADRTPQPIRDPALSSRSYDEIPVEGEEFVGDEDFEYSAPSAPVDEPAIDVPDDGDIPLADEGDGAGDDRDERRGGA